MSDGESVPDLPPEASSALRRRDPVTTELLADVEENAEQYDFFLLVRALSGLLHGGEGAATGGLGPVAREAVRFRNDPSLAFPTSDISQVRLPQPGMPHAVITSTFLGLTGTVSPLPPQLAEEAARASFDGDGDFLAFYDFFHHRLYALLYRSWELPRLPATHQRDLGDAGGMIVRSLVGVIAGDDGAPAPTELLQVAPLTSRRTRSHRALLASLGKLFPAVPIEIETFVERQVPLGREQRTCLGVRNSTLGADVTMGASLVDRGGRFRLVVGPVSGSDHQGFSPGGDAFRRLGRFVEHFTGGLLECEVELRLDPSAVPRLCLGTRGSAELGRTTRLQSQIVEAPVSRFLLDRATMARDTVDAS